MCKAHLSATHVSPPSRDVPIRPRSCLGPRPHIFLRNLSCDQPATRASPLSQRDPTPRQTCLGGPSERQICPRSQPCSLMEGTKGDKDKTMDVS